MAEVRGLPSAARPVGIVGALLLAGVLSPGTLSAQLSPEPARSNDVSYEQRYAELRELQAVPNRIAPVTQLVLKRDAGQFTFGEGRFYLLIPIGGPTMTDSTGSS